ncbi:Aconitate hydratase mitochondrial [Mycoemilia scoparia]|uniref:Aconitate hydratase, mitochondrial n=1 Tax=Mycoemilia scoparia TaxID=417184 RepID=A0A9W7ZWX1_9FUNG|nr:Aconitate hydratase mitochondrial [Mycoemilia scoparia]
MTRNRVSSITNGTTIQALLRSLATGTSYLRSYATTTNTASAGPNGPQAKTSVPQYALFEQKLATARSTIFKDRQLTLAEKILFAHLDKPENLTDVPVRGETYLKLRPDRVAMQDASAPLALLQFMLANMPQTAVPASIHCDHLIEAWEGADSDVKASWETSRETYEFLRAAAAKYGIAFWKPGSGIIHQIVLENYAAPGTLMVGTDSHTPNAGGLGMLAIGVGGADAVDAMAGIPWELKSPRILGVKLVGQLGAWCSPKDVILHLTGLLTVKGGTGSIVEYFGEGVNSLSCTGMATICNMGAEIGATTSVFPYGPAMRRYLKATDRVKVSEGADWAQGSYLCADPDVIAHPEKYYDQIIEIDLSKLEPSFNGPFTPDLSTPLSQMKGAVKKNQWPENVSAALIGSCTNSSYQDLSRAASIARQAAAKGLTVAEGTRFLVTPGSEQIRATMERDGLMAAFESIGAKKLANACGPCIGQWNRSNEEVVKDKKPNSIVSSFNRNFRARNDGNPNTLNFLSSPEMVMLSALSGKVGFDPESDTLIGKDGKEFKLEPPTGDELPSKGYEAGREEYKPLLKYDPETPIPIAPTSKFFQVMEPFPAWPGKDYEGLPILIKAHGKCTTDHISAAGKWLRYRGHLDILSNNTLIGAINAENGEANNICNQITGEWGPVPDVARYYKANRLPWVVIGDENYGEGSARESASLSPRYLGGVAVIVKSFARIHETNLKKQGMLPLTFSDPKDYDLVDPSDKVSILGLSSIAPGVPLTLKLEKKSGEVVELKVNHTFNDNQIGWFKAGSALNEIAEMRRQ